MQQDNHSYQFLTLRLRFYCEKMIVTNQRITIQYQLLVNIQYFIIYSHGESSQSPPFDKKWNKQTHIHTRLRDYLWILCAHLILRAFVVVESSQRGCKLDCNGKLIKALHPPRVLLLINEIAHALVQLTNVSHSLLCLLLSCTRSTMIRSEKSSWTTCSPSCSEEVSLIFSFSS